MGLFTQSLLDGLGIKAAPSIESYSIAEGILAITMAATGADGNASEEEILMIRGVITRMKAFRSYPDDVVVRVIDKIRGDLRRYEFKDIMRAAVEAIPADLRTTVFAIATDLVLADGIIDDSEESLLLILHKMLEVSEDDARLIIQVMAVKNKG